MILTYRIYEKSEHLLNIPSVWLNCIIHQAENESETCLPNQRWGKPPCVFAISTSSISCGRSTYDLVGYVRILKSTEFLHEIHRS